MLRRLLFIVVVAVLSGCQASMVRSFERLHPGMDKSQVLDLVGNPDTTTRLHGQDRWLYNFYEDSIKFEKEIHFLDGVLIYSGNGWSPEPEKSAAAVDKKVQQIEQTFQAEDKEREEQKKLNAEEFRKYQDSRVSDKKVRYVPKFVELK